MSASVPSSYAEQVVWAIYIQASLLDTRKAANVTSYPDAMRLPKLRNVIAALIAGAVVTALVSCWFAMKVVEHGGSPLSSRSQFCRSPMGWYGFTTRDTGVTIVVIESYFEPPNAFMMSDTRGPFPSWSWASSNQVPTTWVPGSAIVGELGVGWPSVSMSHRISWHPDDFGSPGDNYYFLHAYGLPTHVVPTGFTANTLLYAAIIAFLFTAPRTLRRWRRRRQGLCGACGYDLAGIDDACPECGNANSRRVQGN